MTFTLEWNKDQQGFHHEKTNGTHEQNTFGWITIAEKQEDNIISYFCKIVDEFRGYYFGCEKPKKKLNNDEIKILWKLYISGFKPIS